MGLTDFYNKAAKAAKLANPGAAAGVIARMSDIARNLPILRKQGGRGFDRIAGDMADAIKPYQGTGLEFAVLPERGAPAGDIIAEMNGLNAVEEPRRPDNSGGGSAFQAEKEHRRFLAEVCAANAGSDPFHPDRWPSAVKYEAETISMVARVLGMGGPGDNGDTPPEACGVVTSGNTESIILAMKAYRDKIKEEKRVARPEIIAPASVHPAFDKAADFLEMRVRRIPVGEDYRADVGAMRKAVNYNTAVMVGSAPTLPHGVIDPIEELSELALERGLGLHVDASLGGFMLPFAEELGYDVPVADFRLKGVTSISVGTHMYGFAPRGTAVLLHRERELRGRHCFTNSEWPGGVYFSPTLASGRPGALSAACWAALVTTGRDGYRESARAILVTAAYVKRGIKAIPGLKLLGDPLWNIAFTSDDVDIYEVIRLMAGRRWSLAGLQYPPAAGFCLAPRHTRPGVAERFLLDLRDAVQGAGEGWGGTAWAVGGRSRMPMHGPSAIFFDRRLVKESLELYLDIYYDA